MWRYIVLFALLESLIFLLLNYSKNEQKERRYIQNIEQLSIGYEAVFAKYQKLSEAVFCSAIDNNSTYSILIKALKDKNEVNSSRVKLLNTMLPVYLKLKELGVRQFQFHLPDNSSFLRLHEPLSYGDTLEGFRHTVRIVNRDRVAAHGFEEGRAASGLRYVFPVMQGVNHLGSVEFGIDYEAIVSSLKMLSGARYALVVKKDAVGKPDMFKKELDGFTSFKICDDYLLEGKEKKEFRELEKQLIESVKDISKKCASQKPFSTSVDFRDGVYSVTFYPIKDIRGVHAAYLIEYKKDLAYGLYSADLMRAFGVYTLFIAILLSVIFLVNTKRKNIWELNASLEQKSEELQAILDASGGGLAILDGEGRFLYTNSALSLHLGYAKDELLGLDIYKIGEESQKDETKEFIEEALISGSCFNFKKICISKKGKRVVFSMQLTRLPDGRSLILSAADITEDIEYAKSLEIKAATDSLTRVSNRRSLEVSMQDAMNQAIAHGKGLCFVVMDIDNFKTINDTYGHAVGDAVLREFSALVSTTIRTEDIFGRWGGEEFLLVCEGLSIEKAVFLAEKIRGRVEANRFEGLPSVTCSFGVACMTQEDTVQTLFDKADAAMYEAKRAGRNRVETA